MWSPLPLESQPQSFSNEWRAPAQICIMPHFSMFPVSVTPGHSWFLPWVLYFPSAFLHRLLDPWIPPTPPCWTPTTLQGSVQMAPASSHPWNMLLLILWNLSDSFWNLYCNTIIFCLALEYMFTYPWDWKLMSETATHSSCLIAHLYLTLYKLY